MAEDLLKLYSEREMSIGYKFDKDTEEQAYFESEFPYEETKDQKKAIEDIKKDMEKSYPGPPKEIIIPFLDCELSIRSIFLYCDSSSEVINS